MFSSEEEIKANLFRRFIHHWGVIKSDIIAVLLYFFQQNCGIYYSLWRITDQFLV